MFGTSIQNVQIEKLNLDLECMTDILEEKGIRLQSPEAFHKKVDKFSKKTEKVYDGLQSEFFGTDFGDDAFGLPKLRKYPTHYKVCRIFY